MVFLPKYSVMFPAVAVALEADDGVVGLAGGRADEEPRVMRAGMISEWLGRLGNGVVLFGIVVFHFLILLVVFFGGHIFGKKEEKRGMTTGESQDEASERTEIVLDLSH